MQDKIGQTKQYSACCQMAQIIRLPVLTITRGFSSPAISNGCSIDKQFYGTSIASFLTPYNRPLIPPAILWPMPKGTSKVPREWNYWRWESKSLKSKQSRNEDEVTKRLFQTLQGVPRWKDESRRWNVPSRSWKRNPPRTTPPTVTTPPALSVAALAPPPAAVIVPPPATVISSVCVDLTDQHSKDKSTNYNILQERLRCMDAKSLEENLSWSQMRLPPDKPSTEEFPPDLIWTLLQSASFPQELYLWLSANCRWAHISAGRSWRPI